MDEISRRVRDEIGFYNSLENFEMIFNVSVRDWFLDMQETGFASTIIVSSKYKLQWVGDKVRTFKPDSVLTVQVCIILEISLLSIASSKVVDRSQHRQLTEM